MARGGVPSTATAVRCARDRSERGQATVEFALVLPVLVLLLMLVFQVALVARDQVLTVQAARAAAREAAVGADTARVNGAARATLRGAEVSVTSRGAIGEPVVVQVRYRSHTDLPLIGPLVPDPQLTVRAVMRREK
jgi:Flp pilus assembly protein TadG